MDSQIEGEIKQKCKWIIKVNQKFIIQLYSDQDNKQSKLLDISQIILDK
ncbi:unnamed protein product [Paramecium pentaurelia]|uniref:Uncharacterized protein n=1 Tax=Paramecium pentaurelia TaxID=43138 RepID=A0A8S1Y2L6_9CILI|nr:unnamed protein product [Paramecium pentaurelia]